MKVLCDFGMQRIDRMQPQAKPSLPVFGTIRCNRKHRAARPRSAAQSSGLTSSVELGPKDEQASPSMGSASPVEGVEIRSQAGEDYTILRDHLQAGEFQKADDETRALLIRLAGPDAVKRGWVYFTEVKFIPEADLQTIDNLWRAVSDQKFGYSSQKELWLKAGRRWDKFFQQIDWVQGENNNYRKWPKEFTYSTEANRGHLPLTNCLRGTQLFKAILEHPAFVKSESSQNGSNNPTWFDEAEANGLGQSF